jgi:MraZ protein
MAFLGEYQHSIDQKGRMAVPAKFRHELGEGAVVTRGIDTCLFIFPKGEWETFAKKLMQLPLSQSGARAFARLMLSGASDVDFDGQGRVLIPEHLRSYSKMDKKVVVTGLYNRIEVWDQDIWEKYKNKTEQSSEEIAEKLGELGI